MHLHCHSWFSLRYGLMQPRELLAEAQTAGITALALTDINATSAHWDFVRDAPEYGIRPVLGIDFRNASTDRDPAGTPLYIGYARNNTGYANLCAHLNAHLHVHRPFEPVAPALEHTFIVYPWARWKHTRPRSGPTNTSACGRGNRPSSACLKALPMCPTSGSSHCTRSHSGTNAIGTATASCGPWTATSC